MKNELREINKTIQQTEKDNKLNYDIKMQLRKFFKSALQGYEIGKKENGTILYELDKQKIKYLLLEDKDGIIDENIIPILQEKYSYKNIDDLLDLVDDFYVEELNKAYKYYNELKKEQDKDNIDFLEKELYKIFKWSFKNVNGDAKSKLNYIRNITYKDEVRQGLKEKKYDLSNFEKAYNKAFMRFKKDYNNYDDFIEDAKEDAKENDIGFGWRLYGTIKVIEGLFKL